MRVKIKLRPEKIMKMALIMLMAVALFGCTDHDIWVKNPYPELMGAYVNVDHPDNLWRFNETNIATYQHNTDELEKYTMQWKVEAGKFYNRIYGADGDWKAHTFRLSGDTLELGSMVYIKWNMYEPR